MDTKIHMDKLSNENYFTWKYRMEMLLKKEGIWKTITGTRPTATSSTLEKWLEMDEKATALIGLSVHDNQLQHIRNETTAKGSWEALKRYREQGTLVNTTTLMRKLWDLKLKEDENPQMHIQEMTSLLQKLVDSGEPDLTEKWKIAILLSSLSETYHTLVTALEARDQKDLTFTLIQTKVIDEYMRRNSNKNESDEQVLKISERGRTRKYCYYCNEPNHLMRNCWKFKEDIQNGQKERNCVINQYKEDSEDEQDEQLF